MIEFEMKIEHLTDEELQIIAAALEKELGGALLERIQMKAVFV